MSEGVAGEKLEVTLMDDLTGVGHLRLVVDRRPC